MALWNIILLLTCLLNKSKAQEVTRTPLYKGHMVTQEWWDLAKFAEPALIVGTPTTCAGLCIQKLECKFFSIQDGSSCQLGKSDSYAADSPMGTDRLVYAVSKMCPVGSGGTCPSIPSVVDGTYYNDGYKNAVEGGVIFVDGCENGWYDFWNGPNHASGEDDAYLVLDLSCCTLVRKVTIKNSHNFSGYQRQTTLFRLMFSTDTTYVKPDMTWTTVISDELPTITESTPCDEILLTEFEIHPQNARFVKYVVDSYDSFGGGLKYIKIE